MLTWEDCVGLCDLDEDVIDAIAQHEHVPEVVALELAEYLIHCPDGVPRIRRMILDDIERARGHGDTAAVDRLQHALAHFVAYARQVQGGAAGGDKRLGAK